MTDPWWRELLRLQAAQRFVDVAGATGAVRLPISDALITQLVSARLPAGGRVRHITVRALGGNRLRVGVRLHGPSLLPAIYVDLEIVEQPVLPASPIVELRLLSTGLALASQVLRFVTALPPGVDLHRDTLSVNLEQLLAHHGVASLLHWVTSLTLTTEPGRLVVSADLAVPRLEPLARLSR